MSTNSEPDTLSAEDFEVMVLIKLNEMSENANKSERFHTNSTAPANQPDTKPYFYPDHVPYTKNANL